MAEIQYPRAENEPRIYPSEPGDQHVPGYSISAHDGVNLRRAHNGWLITVYKIDPTSFKQSETLWVCAEDKLIETLTKALVADKLR
jgi:hypothetical protein